MTAYAATVTRPSGVKDQIVGAIKICVRDIALDTGTYTTAGQAFTLSQLLCPGKRLLALIPCGLQTNGTSGVTANDVGITYNSTNTTATIQYYESGGSGTAMAEKTSNEAFAANAILRFLVLCQ